MHIRNAPAEGMSEFGYHEGYKYPHDYPGHWVEQQYLPDKMVGTNILGIYEKGLKLNFMKKASSYTIRKASTKFKICTRFYLLNYFSSIVTEFP